MTHNRQTPLAVAVAVCSPGAARREAWLRALIFVRSLRAFGGRFNDAPVRVLVPDTPDHRDPQLEALVAAESASIVPFVVMEQRREIPFAVDAVAAAVAEEAAEDETDALMFVFPDTLVIGPLDSAVPGVGHDACYRPVHIANIGSPWGTPLDPFWTLVYDHCAVTEDRVFPVVTCVERSRLRAYLNAGSLVVRPELHLFRTWSERFGSLAESPEARTLLQGSDRLALFAHQAVLSAVVVAVTDGSRLRELPDTFNYPRHLHSEIPEADRPERLNDLVTCRYELPFEAVYWDRVLPADGELLTWLKAQQADTEPLVDRERLARWLAHLGENRLER